MINGNHQSLLCVSGRLIIITAHVLPLKNLLKFRGNFLRNFAFALDLSEFQWGTKGLNVHFNFQARK